ncbi:MAG: autotransporter-associated beta strand repeat-containing protein, partial [Chthoniobacteraceae bacterium]|nr:autotransporter-associated beta strand repeat-containing protein [Chthoniobacteraceae bacterium]
MTASSSAFDLQSGTVSAVLAGAQGLNKTTSGIGYLSGANTYTGATTIYAGSLILGLGGSSGSLSPSSTLVDYGTLGFNRSDTLTQGTAFAAVISGSGSVIQMGSGTLELQSGNTFSGSLILASGNLKVIGANTSTVVNENASVSLTSGARIVSAIYGNASRGTIDVTSIVSGFIASGTTTFSASNANFTDPCSGYVKTLTLVYVGGDTTTSSNSSFGTSRLVINGGSLDNGVGSEVTMLTNNTQNWNSSFTFIGSSSLNLGTGAVTLGTSPTLTVSAGTLTVGGVISGAFALTKAGSGRLLLTASSSYTGGTTVSAGSLLLSGGSNRLSISGAITGAGGVLDLGGDSQSSSGVIALTGGTFQNGTLTATGSAFDMRSGSVTATLSGAQGLNKTTTGSVTLTNSNSYTGGTTV